MLAWLIVYHLLFRPTPKPLNPWRLWLLKRFGATITGTPFVHGQAIIRIPWLLTLEHRAAIAQNAEIYNLDRCTLRERCVVSQHAYLCGGTHDLEDPALPLLVGEIDIGPDAFIGARAMILPGVTLGPGAVLAAAAVATKDLDPWTIYAGNPARPIRPRALRHDHPKPTTP